MKTRWRTLSGERIDNIVHWVEKSTQHGQTLHIGTDSLQVSRWSQFVTVVVILNPPHGGRVAYVREVVPRISSLRQRLTKEVWMSVELALRLPMLPTIHIDASSDEKFASQRYLQSLVGMVVGQGFKAVWKPDAPIATHVADHVVRSKGKLPKGVQRRRRTA